MDETSSFTLFIKREQDSFFLNGSSWTRTFKYFCCLWLFNQRS